MSEIRFTVVGDPVCEDDADCMKEQNRKRGKPTKDVRYLSDAEQRKAFGHEPIVNNTKQEKEL